MSDAVLAAHATHSGAEFASVVEALAARASELRALAGLRGKLDDDVREELCERTTELEKVASGFRSFLNVLEDDISELRVVRDAVVAQRARAEAMKEAARLNHAAHGSTAPQGAPVLADATNVGRSHDTASKSAKVGVDEVGTSEGCEPLDVDNPGSAAHVDASPVASAGASTPVSRGATPTWSTGGRRGAESTRLGFGGGDEGGEGGARQLRELTEEEFEAVPSYQRGRVSLVRVNGAVREINAVLEKKYKLLAQPIGRIRSARLRAAAVAFREQETTEADGFRFFVAADVAKCEHAKQDASGKCVIKTLRHVGQLRQLTDGGQLTRYLLC